MGNMVFNNDLFLQKLKENGYTKCSFAKAVGLHPSTINYWSSGKFTPGHTSLMTIKKVLGISIKDIMIPEKKKEKAIENNEKEEKPASEEVAEENDTVFKKLESKKIDENFETINNNILGLATLVQSLQEDLHKAYVRIYELENRTILTNVKKTEKERIKPIAASYPKYTKEELINGYSEDDTAIVWKGKILCMAAMCKNVTIKQILHQNYREMTKIYGVCWEQEKKDYYDKYHQGSSSTLDVVYDNPMHRSILYAMFVDKITE